MTPSPSGAFASSGAFARIVRSAFGYWRGGAAVALFVLCVLAARWLHLASHVYESRAVVELAASEAGANGTPAEREPRAADLKLLVLDALPELTDRPGTVGDALSLAPDSMAVRAVGEGRLVLVCRADEPHAAYQRCAQAVSAALPRIPALRVVVPATLTSQPLAPASGAVPLVLIGSGLIGLLGGATWMLARALLSLWVATQRTVRKPAAPVGTVSYAPSAPARVAPVSAPQSAQDLRVARVQDEREHPPHTTAWPKPRVRPDERAQGAVEPGTVVALKVADNWGMDASLTDSEPATDLQTLCSELCVAAAQGCFVVAVTGAPHHRPLKSRLAAKLAWLLAQTEQPRVLLLEVDLNHPAVDSVMRLDMPPRSGFTQQLQARLHHEGRPAPWVVVHCTAHLSVLGEGRLRTPGMLYSPQFSTALAQLRHHFDVIVADGPVIGHSVDAHALDDIADGIVFAAPASMPAPEALAVASQWFRNRQLLAVATLPEPA